MEATILNYRREHVVLIDMTRGINRSKLKRALKYGAHYSAVKEKDFVRKEISKQLRAGHVAIYPLEDVKHLQGIWISPLAAIIQVGRNPRLIYDFSWSGLKEKVKLVAPK